MEQRLYQVIPIKDLCVIIVAYTKYININDVPWDQCTGLSAPKIDPLHPRKNFQSFILYGQPLNRVVINDTKIMSQMYRNDHHCILVDIPIETYQKMHNAFCRLLPPAKHRLEMPLRKNGYPFKPIRIRFSPDKRNYIARDETGKRIADFRTFCDQQKGCVGFRVSVVFTVYVSDYQAKAKYNAESITSLFYILREIQILRRTEEFIQYDLEGL